MRSRPAIFFSISDEGEVLLLAAWYDLRGFVGLCLASAFSFSYIRRRRHVSIYQSYYRREEENTTGWGGWGGDVQNHRSWVRAPQVLCLFPSSDVGDAFQFINHISIYQSYTSVFSISEEGEVLLLAAWYDLRGFVGLCLASAFSFSYIRRRRHVSIYQSYYRREEENTTGWGGWGGDVQNHRSWVRAPQVLCLFPSSDVGDAFQFINHISAVCLQPALYTST